MAPLFFFLFILVVYLVLVNMFITILNESIAVVTNDLSLQSNEYEMVDFIMSRFKMWMGFGSVDMTEEKEDAAEEPVCSPATNDVERFPVVVEDLLERLCRLYEEQIMKEFTLKSLKQMTSKKNVSFTKVKKEMSLLVPNKGA